MQIAKLLTAERVLNPMAYKRKQGRNVPNPESADPCHWSTNTVVNILERREYMGCTVNFKTYTVSIWDKKQQDNPEEKQGVFYGTHPAIIEPEIFDKVQEIRQQRHRRIKTGKSTMFSGLVYCADCGAKMRYCTTSYFEKRQDHFVCANYRSNTGSCSAHFIRAVVLEELVWMHMEAVISYVTRFEPHFRAVMEEQLKLSTGEAVKVRRKKLAQDETRLVELDRLFLRLYEDHALGKLTDERYNRLSGSYEAEQRDWEARVNELRRDLERGQEEAVNVAQFVALVKKYTEVRELTPTIVNEFIKVVIVHAPTKVNGHRSQFVQVVYNLVGEVTIPKTPDSKTA